MNRLALTPGSLQNHMPFKVILYTPLPLSETTLRPLKKETLTSKRCEITYAETAFVNHCNSIEHSFIENNFMPSLWKLCMQIVTAKCNHGATHAGKDPGFKSREINLSIHKLCFYLNFKQELGFFRSKYISNEFFFLLSLWLVSEHALAFVPVILIWHEH